MPSGSLCHPGGKRSRREGTQPVGIRIKGFRCGLARINANRKSHSPQRHGVTEKVKGGGQECPPHTSRATLRAGRTPQRPDESEGSETFDSRLLRVTHCVVDNGSDR